MYEVGPRDGLQNEATTVPAAVKAEFVRRLGAAGLATVGTTSFVDPRWVAQLADAEDLLGLLGADGRGPQRPVLVPNERGLDRALASGVGAVAIFGSATETFARKNLNRTVAESVAMFAPVVERARADGLWDMEGELRDVKHYDHPNDQGTRQAGQPEHHLWLRVPLLIATVAAMRRAASTTTRCECWWRRGLA